MGNKDRVLRSDERGKRGAVILFPDGFRESSRWGEIYFLYGGSFMVTNLVYPEKRWEMIIEKLNVLVSLGDFYAMNFLGACYQRGIGVRENIDTAMDLYRRAALSGSVPIAWFNIGMVHWNRGDYHTAVDAFIEGKRLGCQNCVVRLL